MGSKLKKRRMGIDSQDIYPHPPRLVESARQYLNLVFFVGGSTHTIRKCTHTLTKRRARSGPTVTTALLHHCRFAPLYVCAVVECTSVCDSAVELKLSDTFLPAWWWWESIGLQSEERSMSACRMRSDLSSTVAKRSAGVTCVTLPSITAIRASNPLLGAI